MIFRSLWPDIETPNVSVCDAVLGGAQRFGDKQAVIESETGQALTYRGIIEGSERVAAGLARAGLQPGQPLALALPNCLEFVLAWFGALRAGGWVVPINPLYTAAEMELQIRDSGARFLIGAAECAAAMQPVVEKSFVPGVNWNELADCDAPPPDVHPRPDDLAVLPYSSGTTGKPKGVMMTHANIVANICQESVLWARPTDVIVNMFPLYHVAGLNCFLNGLLLGGATIVLMRRFELERYLSLCEQYRATVVGGPPPVILALTKSPLWDKFDLSSIKLAMCGAAPLGAELHEAFEQRTGVMLGQCWGMTEATALVSGTPEDPTRRKFGSCGYLVPGCEAQVVDVATLQPLGPGETGEIWLRGPNIVKGYWNQPAANAETFVDGWMRTGDIGYFDADSCIYLVDRLKELIKYNALQVAPAELEDIIQSHPSVRDAAVIGAPEPSVGEIPMAFVVKREGAQLEAEELMQYVAARVAPYKKIRAVEFLEAIPKSPTGKILRRVLRDQVRTRSGAGGLANGAVTSQ
jgi:acyl-CoA synthetase (AMP-forming)/AMP-acid ligase II